ncbi:hypothetical protein LX36DRAFT_452764 [Colletotrichum falcatum]|nr:hypothetical protein LX36DRAFT_452764 [Colletotrichum falcatum]
MQQLSRRGGASATDLLLLVLFPSSGQGSGSHLSRSRQSIKCAQPQKSLSGAPLQEACPGIMTPPRVGLEGSQTMDSANFPARLQKPGGSNDAGFFMTYEPGSISLR